MKEDVLSKREFLKRTAVYAGGTVLGIGAINTLSGNKLFADPKVATWPLPYVKLDPEEAMLLAHKLYWEDKDCGAGVFGSLVTLLAEKIGEPWSNIPMEIFLFGRGGGAGWGSLCGTLNGASGIISSVVNKADSTNIINELWGWYTTEALPSKMANQAAMDGKFVAHKFDGDLPQSISGSPLCHVSVSLWSDIAHKKTTDLERKERCGRLSGDIAYKTVQILNDYFDQKFAPTWKLPESNTSCMNCHGTTAYSNVMTNMTCNQCHGDDPHSVQSVKSMGGNPVDINLYPNFPNPFMSSTNIKFDINNNGVAKLEIYDQRGYLVKTLFDNTILETGKYEATWNASDNNNNIVPAGIYLAKLTFGNSQRVIKLNLIK